MIKYNLNCHNNHEFESWFLDSKEFENLKKKKNVRMYILPIKKNFKINNGSNDFSYRQKRY